MTLKFSKMHGLGNDFMVIELLSQSLSRTSYPVMSDAPLNAESNPTDCQLDEQYNDISDERLSAELVRRWSDRHFGVGFDQLLLVEAPTKPEFDFRYRIYNADGGEVEQCGNGARCFAKFVIDQKLTPKRTLQVQTSGGDITLIVNDDDQITVDMGAPRFTPASLPFIADNPSPSYPLLVGDQHFEISAISMGNPHAVMIVDDIDSAPVADIGPLIEAHKRFAKRVNVGFMQIHSPTEASVRVYERGAGETLACGTGACAAVVAGRLRGLLAEQVTVHLRGGDLHISWANDIGDDIQRRSQRPVFMTGPATHVFNGEIGYDG